MLRGCPGGVRSVGRVLVTVVVACAAAGSARADAPVVVALPTEMSPVTLFGDERTRIRERVAEALAARGHAVMAVEDVERIERNALQGGDMEGGPTRCRTPLRRDEIERRLGREHPIARVEARCIETDCRLNVSFEVPADATPIVATYESRRVATPSRASEWIRAADELRPTTALYGASGGWGSSSHSAIVFSTPVGIGPWRGEVPSEPLDAALGVVSRCAHPDPIVGLTHEIRASIGTDGRMQRCEIESASWLARAEDQRCICDGMAGLRFAAGRAGRRFRVEARDTAGAFPAGPVVASFATAMPGTEDWIERLRTSPALDACLAEQLPGSDVAASVTLALQADGTVSDVHIGGIHQHADTVRFIACVSQELRAVPLPCRPNGQTELSTQLIVDLAAPSVPAMRRDFVPR